MYARQSVRVDGWIRFLDSQSIGFKPAINAFEHINFTMSIPATKLT